MQDFKPESFYQGIKVGDNVEIESPSMNKVLGGVLMDKYCGTDNVYADILLDPIDNLPNRILERVPFFSKGKQIIHIIDAV